MEKPINIKNAITLLYISLGLGLLQVFIILSSSIYRAYFGIGNTIPLALFWFVTYMVANGKNWARIILVILYISGVPFLYIAMEALFTLKKFDNWYYWLVLIRMALGLYAIILLFQPTSSNWFRHMKTQGGTQPKFNPKDYYPPSPEYKKQNCSMRQMEWKRACDEGELEARRRVEELQVQRVENEKIRRIVEEEIRYRANEEARQRAEQERARRRAEEELVRKEIQKSFDVFELPYSASFDDVKKQYWILLQFFHPDKHSSNNILREYAEEKTKEINKAFNILKLRHFKV